MSSAADYSTRNLTLAQLKHESKIDSRPENGGISPRIWVQSANDLLAFAKRAQQQGNYDNAFVYLRKAAAYVSPPNLVERELGVEARSGGRAFTRVIQSHVEGSLPPRSAASPSFSLRDIRERRSRSTMRKFKGS